MRTRQTRRNCILDRNLTPNGKHETHPPRVKKKSSVSRFKRLWFYLCWCKLLFKGAGIAQWLEHRTRDWKVAGSNPCWNGGRIFFSRVDFPCWLLFRYPFHPRVTTVARKKSRSFRQKCRWQVTAKHAYTLRIEPCFGIGHNLSLMCQMTSEDIKHQLNNNNCYLRACFGARLLRRYYSKGIAKWASRVTVSL